MVLKAIFKSECVRQKSVKKGVLEGRAFQSVPQMQAAWPPSE